ncbi:hypothetical protein GEMRC1_004459 [Eukaryota sp. GEM-RC1]
MSSSFKRSLLDSPRTPRTSRFTDNKTRSDSLLILEDVRPVDGRINLNKKRLKSLTGLKSNPKTEFLYLRDNCISSLSNVPIMKNLKILDIGYNELTTLGFLSSFPSLRQLYVNSNQLSTLSDMPSLAFLEHFSFSQNDVSSFEGMPPLPELRVLCGSGNNISSFDGLPHFHNLEVLRLIDNPIAGCNDFRLLSCCVSNPDTLRKVDGSILSEEEHFAAVGLPLKLGFCCRNGFVPSSLDQAGVTCDTWWIDEQKKSSPELMGIELVGNTVEEQTLQVNVTISPQISAQTNCEMSYSWLRYVAADDRFFELPGTNSDTYVLTSDDVDTFLMARVTVSYGDSIALDASSSTFTILSDNVTSAPPMLYDLEIVGEPIEGDILTAHCRYSGGKQKGIKYQWLRSGRPLPGATGRTLVCQLEDVGHVISIKAIPIRSDGLEGDAVVQKTTSVVAAALPSVTEVCVDGPFIEREVLQGHGTYFGGKEGNSIFQWFRVSEKSDGREYVEISDATSLYYTPTSDDFSHRLVFQYTPVSTEGVPGTPVSVITQPIGAGCPTISNLIVDGEIMEGEPVKVVHNYLGGYEGSSLIQWFCSSALFHCDLNELSNEEIEILYNSLESNEGRPDPSLWMVIDNAIFKEFVPRLDHVGRLLCVLYLPVRDDGIEGEPRVAMSRSIVAVGQPKVTGIEIEGVAEQGSELIGDVHYQGGNQGESRLRWLRVDKSNPKEPKVLECVAENTIVYAPVTADVGNFLRLECVPVREDGVVGLPFCKDTSVSVKCAVPRYFDVGIEGIAVEGTRLTMTGVYFGGIEGQSKIEWIVIDENGKESIVLIGERSLILTEEHVDHHVCLRVTPTRDDGAVGEVIVTDPIGPVTGTKPVVSNLVIKGSAFVDSDLEISFDYTGSGTPLFLIDWFRNKKVSNTVTKAASSRVSEENLSKSLSFNLSMDDIGSEIEVRVVVQRLEDEVFSETISACIGPVLTELPYVSDLTLSPFRTQK